MLAHPEALGALVSWWYPFFAAVFETYCAYPSISMIPAAPWPPPTHIVTRP